MTFLLAGADQASPGKARPDRAGSSGQRDCHSFRLRPERPLIEAQTRTAILTGLAERSAELVPLQQCAWQVPATKKRRLGGNRRIAAPPAPHRTGPTCLRPWYASDLTPAFPAAPAHRP